MSLNLSRVVRATAIIFTVAIFASAARAADGAIEISQACVATGCGTLAAFDAPGFPVSTELGKHYVLTSNLTVPDANTTAVSLAQQASLDMNGFSIIGPVICIGKPASCGTGSGVGVVMNPESTLRNGTIRGMGDDGIRGNAAAVIEDMLVLRNGGNGINLPFNAARIAGCRVLANGNHGIDASPGGGSGGELLVHNVVYANHTEGIRVGTALVLGNTVTLNGGFGIGNPAYDVNKPMAIGHNLVIRNLAGVGDDQLAGPFLEIRPNACGTDKVCP